jgi:hypothetical protein
MPNGREINPSRRRIGNLITVGEMVHEPAPRRMDVAPQFNASGLPYFAPAPTYAGCGRATANRTSPQTLKLQEGRAS